MIFTDILISLLTLLAFTLLYRSPVKERQVSWLILGIITLNGTDTAICKYCQTVRTKRLHIYIKSFCCSVSAIQSFCPQNKPADLPLILETCTYLFISTHGGDWLRRCFPSSERRQPPGSAAGCCRRPRRS